MKPFAFLILVLSLASRTLSAGDNSEISPEERRGLEATPAVVFIQVWYKWTLKTPGGEKEMEPIAFSGTGFLYRPDGYLITNAHVVEDANIKDETAIADRETTAKRAGLKWIQDNRLHHQMTREEAQAYLPYIGVSDPHLEVYLNNHTMYTGEIKAYSDPSFVNNGKDIAIVKIDGNNLPTVKLGNSDEVHLGEPLMVVGYPGVAMNSQMIGKQSELVPSVTGGHVSAVKTDYKGTPVIQSDAAITHGNSGGPAFNLKDEAVGIATYGNIKEVAGFNFFVPINTAMEFVRQAGAAPEQGAFDKAWGGALDAYQAAKWDTAKGFLADALNLMPNEPDVMRLQTIATQQARSEGQFARSMEGLGGMRWPAIGLAGILGIGLITFLMMRSRGGAAPVAATGVPVRGVVLDAPIAANNPGAQNAPHQSLPGTRQINAVAPGHGVAGSVGSTFGTLHVTAGSLNGNRFPITKSGLLIGRDSAKCQIVISDDTISKEHAWVVPVDHEVVVIDRGSSNGTYINSTDSGRVNKVALRNGDRVYIGKQGAAVLTYHSS